MCVALFIWLLSFNTVFSRLLCAGLSLSIMMLCLGMPGAGAHLGPTSHSPRRHFPDGPVPWLDLPLRFLLQLQDASQ